MYGENCYKYKVVIHWQNVVWFDTECVRALDVRVVNSTHMFGGEKVEWLRK